MSDTNNNDDNNSDNNNDVQEDVLQALERLSTKLVELDDVSTDDTKLSHWRIVPSFSSTNNVEMAYKIIHNGATLIKATSTKYTLVTKVDAKEGSKLSQDLLRGCELVTTGALMLFEKEAGCSRSVRTHVKQSIRSVVATVVFLLQAFIVVENNNDKSSSSGVVETNNNNNNNNMSAAQKTGAVWSSCDAILIKLPQGNRAAMRRDLFTWSMECLETIKEFQEMVENSTTSTSIGDGNGNDGATDASKQQEEDDDDGSWNDDFCCENDDDDQYTTNELPIVQATLALLKCSRGTLNVTLKACECAGEQVEIQMKKHSDNDVDSKQQETTTNVDSKQQTTTTNNDQISSILEWIQSLHNMARLVGEGVTDLGIHLYPPLELLQQQQQSGGDHDDDDDGSNKSSSPGLEKQLNLQRNAIVNVQNYILDATANHVELTEEITEMATKLRAAAQTHHDEATAAIMTSKLSSSA